MLWFMRADNSAAVEYVLTYCEAKVSRYPSQPQGCYFRSRRYQDTVGSPVQGWNLAAELSTGDILMMIADDYYPPVGWDSSVRRELQDPWREAVLWVRNLIHKGDGSTDRFDDGNMCHPIFTRSYYRRYGYFLHPAYYARASDNEFTEKAVRDGVIIDARERLAFFHEAEEANRNIIDRHPRDAETWQARKKAGYPEDWKPWQP